MLRLLARLASRFGRPGDSERVRVLQRNAAAAFGAGQYAEAGRQAAAAIAVDPESAGSYFLLGSARLQLGALAKAETAFDECLARKPEYPVVLHAQMCRALARARVSLAAGRTPRVLDRAPDSSRRVSVVICSIDAQRFERACASYRAALKDVPHEIVGIHDARSLCEGYNRGAARATGELLVFSHDDVEIVTPDFAARIHAHLARNDLAGIAGTTRLIGGSWTYAGWPHLHGQVGSRVLKPNSLVTTVFRLQGAPVEDAQALDGVFLAMRREVWERVRFDEKTFDGWHLYDLDFSFSAHLAGFRAAVCQDICLIHDSSGQYSADWQRYVERFEAKHGMRLQKGQWQAQQRCSVEVASAAEWMLMTEEMTC